MAAAEEFWTNHGVELPLAQLLVQAGVPEGAVADAAALPRSLDSFIAVRTAALRNEPAVQAARQLATQLYLSMAVADAAAKRKASTSIGEAREPAPKPSGAGGTQTADVVQPRRAAAPHQAQKRPLTLVVDATASGPVTVTGPERITAEQVESAAKEKQATLLAALLGEAQVATACGYRNEEWAARPPEKRRALWLKHATSYSEGKLRSTRCSLIRLSKWLEAEGLLEACSGWSVSGGLLAEWTADEKSASRAAGDSIPGALRGDMVFASEALKLKGLGVKEPAFVNATATAGKEPTPALAATAAMLFHFAGLARSHPRPIVRHYAAGMVLVTLAALRIRDAQRAHIEVHATPVRGAALEGKCYTSKHPKRRAPKPMPFWLPPSHELLGDWPSGLQYQGPDYIFPVVQVPRGSRDGIADARAAVADGPARSQYVIKHMRAMLRLDGFMSAAQAKRFSGHSGRHTLVTIARLLRYKSEDRHELGRWLAALSDKKERRASMPNAYSSEGEQPRVLEVITRLLGDIRRRVPSPSELSHDDPWAPFRGAAGGSAGGEHIDAEASSSESDASDEEET